MRKNLVGPFIVLAATIGLLGGCATQSGDPTSNTPSVVSPTSSIPPVTTQPSGGSVIGPVIVDVSQLPTSRGEGSYLISTVMGRQIVLNVPGDAGGWTAETSKPGIVKFTPGGSQGTYTTNPGLEPVGEGMTMLVLSDAANPETRRYLTVLVGADAANNGMFQGNFGGNVIENPEKKLGPLLIGKPEQEATEVARRLGYTTRVVSRDGLGGPVTMDYSLKRVNLTLTKGVVTAVKIG
jgi:hypothetical protein